MSAVTIQEQLDLFLIKSGSTSSFLADMSSAILV